MTVSPKVLGVLISAPSLSEMPLFSQKSIKEYISPETEMPGWEAVVRDPRP
jgi:hypothetical protein